MDLRLRVKRLGFRDDAAGLWGTVLATPTTVDEGSSRGLCPNLLG